MINANVNERTSNKNNNDAFCAQAELTNDRNKLVGKKKIHEQQKRDDHDADEAVNGKVKKIVDAERNAWIFYQSDKNGIDDPGDPEIGKKQNQCEKLPVSKFDRTDRIENGKWTAKHVREIKKQDDIDQQISKGSHPNRGSIGIYFRMKQIKTIECFRKIKPYAEVTHHQQGGTKK